MKFVENESNRKRLMLVKTFDADDTGTEIYGVKAQSQ